MGPMPPSQAQLTDAQRALLASRQLLAEHVCRAYLSGTVSTQLAGLLQQLCSSAAFCSVGLVRGGSLLATVGNLLTPGAAKLTLMPTASMAAGLAVHQRRWFHCSIPVGRTSKYADLQQAASCGCDSVVCIPIPLPATPLPAGVPQLPGVMGVLTLGLTSSDAVDLRLLSSLLFLAQYMARHLAAQTVPLLHGVGLHMLGPLLRGAKRGPSLLLADKQSSPHAAKHSRQLYKSMCKTSPTHKQTGECSQRTESLGEDDAAHFRAHSDGDSGSPKRCAPPTFFQQPTSPKKIMLNMDGRSKGALHSGGSNSSTSSMDIVPSSRFGPPTPWAQPASPSHCSAQPARSPRSAFTAWQPAGAPSAGPRREHPAISLVPRRKLELNGRHGSLESNITRQYLQQMLQPALASAQASRVAQVPVQRQTRDEPPSRMGVGLEGAHRRQSLPVGFDRRLLRGSAGPTAMDMS